MTITILDYRNIDINNIEFTSPEKIKGSYYSFAKYKGEDIYIKTPMLTNLSNIVKLDTRCYIELDIDIQNNTTNDFYEFFSNLDDNNILKIHKESENWFNKNFPLDVVEDFYTTPLKHKNSPKLKFKIPLIKNKVDCLIYDKNNTIITNFNKNNKVICVLKYCGLKFLSQQVISEWVPIQIKINEVVNNHNIEYLIQDTFKDPMENIHEITPETITETIPENITETIPETITETIPETITETIPETITETITETIPETIIETIPETITETIPQITKDENLLELKQELEKYKQLFLDNQTQLDNIKNLVI